MLPIDAGNKCQVTHQKHTAYELNYCNKTILKNKTLQDLYP